MRLGVGLGGRFGWTFWIIWEFEGVKIEVDDRETCRFVVDRICSSILARQS